MADDAPRPLWEHLDELRARLIVCLAAAGCAGLAALVWAEPLVRWLAWPLEEAGRLQGIATRLVATSPVEVFVVAFKASMLAGVGAAFPVILYEAFRFVDPALRGSERKAIYPVVGFGAALFYGGVWAGYRWLMPWMFGALLSSQRGFGIEPLWTMEKYFSTEIAMLFLCGLMLEIPLVMAVLGRLGVLSPDFFRGKVRIVIFAAAVLSAWVTPTADPFTMIVVGALIIGFVGLGWIGLWMFAKR